MRRYFLIFSFFALMTSITALAKEKLSCEAAELQSKQCRLILDDIQIELRAENILVFGKAQARLFPTPIKSSLSAWDSVELKKVRSQLFLDFVSWDMPGSAGQQLMQSISKINGDKLEPISLHAIQTKLWNAKTPSGQYTQREPAQILVNASGKTEIKY